MGGGKCRTLNLLPMSWTCPLCKCRFQGQMSKAAHSKNFWKSRNDPTRCDYSLHDAARSEDASESEDASASTHTSDSEDASASTHTSESEDASESTHTSESEDAAEAASATITTPATPLSETPLYSLAARQRNNISEERRRRVVSYTMTDAQVPANMFPRVMTGVMQSWESFKTRALASCSQKFWKFYLEMHSQAGVAIDKALRAVKENFMNDEYGTDAWHKFPGSRKVLFRKLSAMDKFFWPHVTHTAGIDLSKHGLPNMYFKFFDPIFAWLIAARRQRADDMHWKPAPARSSSGAPMYGAGIQQGKSFQQACQSCPEGTDFVHVCTDFFHACTDFVHYCTDLVHDCTDVVRDCTDVVHAGAYPMCFSLHWDGTTSRGLSADPICVGVANTNSSNKDTQFCLGYIPSLSHLGKEFLSSSAATEIKFHVRQQAVGAVLAVLEAAARSGVVCTLKNCRGKDVRLLLMPRLLCMNIDQPEAQLYFGMKNRWVCTKCKRREGYSAFRPSVEQHGPTIQCLYAFVKNGTPIQKDHAARMLARYGFNPQRHCRLTHVADKLLVRVPNVLGYKEVFPSVDYRDKMHGMMIFFHRELTKSLNQILWESRRGLKIKEILDKRLAKVCIRGTLRDQNTGRSVRIQKSIFSDKDLSATDRVAAVFLLPHVLGHRGLMVPENVRIALLSAISIAQLMLIAASGRRQYTMTELREIFDEGYRDLFAALELINGISENQRYRTRLQKHSANPDKNPAPKRFKSHRYECCMVGPCSHTSVRT